MQFKFVSIFWTILKEFKLDIGKDVESEADIRVRGKMGRAKELHIGSVFS